VSSSLPLGVTAGPDPRWAFFLTTADREALGEERADRIIRHLRWQADEVAARDAEIARFSIAFIRAQGAFTDAEVVVIPDAPEQLENAVKAMMREIGNRDEEIARLRKFYGVQPDDYTRVVALLDEARARVAQLEAAGAHILVDGKGIAHWHRRCAQLEALLDRCPEWPHEHGDCILDGDLNADKCVSCAFNREADAALKGTP
jgi:hypothetical protein